MRAPFLTRMALMCGVMIICSVRTGSSTLLAPLTMTANVHLYRMILHLLEVMT